MPRWMRTSWVGLPAAEDCAEDNFISKNHQRTVEISTTILILRLERSPYPQLVRTSWVELPAKGNGWNLILISKNH